MSSDIDDLYLGELGIIKDALVSIKSSMISDEGAEVAENLSSAADVLVQLGQYEESYWVAEAKMTFFTAFTEIQQLIDAIDSIETAVNKYIIEPRG